MIENYGYGITIMKKDELRAAIKEYNPEILKTELVDNPSTIRKIQRLLYDLEENVRWGAAKAFGIAAAVFEEEKMKDIIRQLVWMINEESGNNCWFAPQALGEIGRIRPDLIENFIPCLQEFHKYPDSKIQEGLDFTFNVLKEAGLEIPEE
jgi:hypothetical protein